MALILFTGISLEIPASQLAIAALELSAFKALCSPQISDCWRWSEQNRIHILNKAVGKDCVPLHYPKTKNIQKLSVFICAQAVSSSPTQYTPTYLYVALLSAKLYMQKIRT